MGGKGKTVKPERTEREAQKVQDIQSVILFF